MVWAVASMLIIAGVIVAGTDSIRALDGLTETNYEKQVQARAVSHAGIVDAVAWFRRQQTQPVRAFAPRREFMVDDLLEEGESIYNETDDDAIGLVREYEISPGFWGRYEVRKGTLAETFADTNQNGRFDVGEAFDDLNNDRKRTPSFGTRDLSDVRGMDSTGVVWHIESIGMLYKRNKPNEPLGSQANPLIAKYRLSSDIQRITITLPAMAAINARTGGLVQVRRQAIIRAPQTGVAVGTAAVAVQVSRPAEIIAPIDAVNIPGYKDELYDIFGMEWAELHALADVSVTSSPAELGRIPDGSLVVVTGDLVFDQTNPLEGLAILAVQGDVTVEADSGSDFRGVLYVDGHLTIESPAKVRGTIVTTGWVKLIGSTTSDLVDVEHDPDLVDGLLRDIGQYRQAKVVYPTATMLADGRPTEALTSRSDAVEETGGGPGG